MRDVKSKYKSPTFVGGLRLADNIDTLQRKLNVRIPATEMIMSRLETINRRTELEITSRNLPVCTLKWQ